MSLRAACLVLLWFGIVAVVISDVGRAGEPWLVGRQHQAVHAGGSTGLAVKTLPPTFHFERPVPAKHAAACGVEVPRYEWGSFGARYHYRHGAHFTYYNDFVKWCYK